MPLNGACWPSLVHRWCLAYTLLDVHLPSWRLTLPITEERCQYSLYADKGGSAVIEHRDTIVYCLFFRRLVTL